MKKIRVAVFNTQAPHLYIGGVEHRILKVAQELAKKATTTVYSGTKKGFRETTSLKGATFVPCFSTNTLFPIDNWVFNKTLSRMVNSINADVYECHNVSAYGLLRPLIKRNRSSRFIHTIHGPLVDEYMQSSLDVTRVSEQKFRTWKCGGFPELNRNLLNTQVS